MEELLRRQCLSGGECKCRIGRASPSVHSPYKYTFGCVMFKRPRIAKHPVAAALVSRITSRD